jgi:hypothetical protein
VDFRFEDTRPRVTNDAILDDLRRVAADIGDSTVAQSRYRECGRFSHFVVKKRFGSWNGALIAAGLALHPSRCNIPDDELFDNLRRAWITLGRQPRQREMAAPLSQFGHHAYVRRFGGWLAAMRAFVDAQGSSTEIQPATAVREVGATRQPSMRLRFQVMQRDSFRCMNCGRSPATHPGVILHLDHVMPFSKGGQTDLTNLKTVCASCNLGKGDSLP